MHYRVRLTADVVACSDVPERSGDESTHQEDGARLPLILAFLVWLGAFAAVRASAGRSDTSPKGGKNSAPGQNTLN